MIDLNAETLLTPAEAASRVPSFRPGKKTNVATIFRWAKDGIRGVKLDSARLGGRVVTSVEALQRFSDALSAKPAPPANNPNGFRSSAARQRSAERAERELERIGL